MSIEVKDINKKFGRFHALKEINLEVPTGKLVALLGPSGSGKSTLLRIVAGLEIPDTGAILLNGSDVTSHGVRERQTGFVFQHYALFRHMTVYENIAFGLNVKPKNERMPKEAINKKVNDLLKLVQLDWVSDRYPDQLSGGQRQRIALARALAIEPKILLLDEPFGALDAKVRKDLRTWLRRLHDDMFITSVFVTHDQEEALEVADSVVVMNEGRIEQIGTPEEIYDSPVNSFVYNFIGGVNLFHCRVHKGLANIGDIEIDVREHADTNDAKAVAYVRPHEFDIARDKTQSDAFEAHICSIRCVGPIVRLELIRKDAKDIIEAEMGKDRYSQLAPKVGETVFVKPKKVKVFVEPNSTK